MIYRVAYFGNHGYIFHLSPVFELISESDTLLLEDQRCEKGSEERYWRVYLLLSLSTKMKKKLQQTIFISLDCNKQ